MFEDGSAVLVEVAEDVADELVDEDVTLNRDDGKPENGTVAELSIQLTSPRILAAE